MCVISDTPHLGRVMRSERPSPNETPVLSRAMNGQYGQLSTLEEDGAQTDPNLLAPSSAERREHSRRFSNIHARNLSAFFPRPGTAAEQEYYSARAGARSPSPVDVAPAGAITQESPTSKQRRNARHIRRASYVMTDETGNVNMARRMPSQLPSRKLHTLTQSPSIVATCSRPTQRRSAKYRMDG